MMKYFSKSLLLLVFGVAICCVVYPLVLWVIGQTLFPFQSNGSMLNGPDGKYVGSRLIAQPFTKDEYFQPRPSAASYDASASASSSLAASNYGCATGWPARLARSEVQERPQGRTTRRSGRGELVQRGQVPGKTLDCGPVGGPCTIPLPRHG